MSLHDLQLVRGLPDRSLPAPAAPVFTGPVTGVERPPPSSGQRFAQTVLATLAALLLWGLAQMTVLGGFIHDARQAHMFDVLRNELALGTAPANEVLGNGRALPDGTPIAIMEIPSIGLKQVVAEGTTGEVLIGGPGHLRDTPLPGEAGTAQIFGRQATYGGPFGRIGGLRPGQLLKFTTAAGTFRYRVLDVRHPGDPLPPVLAGGRGRVTLVTAQGTPLVPSGVLRVDADLVGSTAFGSSAADVTLAGSERAMGADTSSVGALLLWLEALTLTGVVGAVVWARWGRVRSWILVLPPAVFVDYFVVDQVTRLLPNLI